MRLYGRWWAGIGVLACLWAVLGCNDDRVEEAPPLQMTAYSCSVRQGFHFDATYPDLCGYLTALTIDGTELSADLTVTDPLNPSATRSVVGVVAHTFWRGGYLDPLYVLAQVSAANKDRLHLLTQSPTANRPVTFRFALYAFDHIAKAYYPCFSDNGAVLSGFTHQQGLEPALTIESDPDTEVTDPENYTMLIVLKPANQLHILHLATGVDKTLHKAWGVSTPSW